MKELTPINELQIETNFHSFYEKESFGFLSVTEIPQQEFTGKKSGRTYSINKQLILHTNPNLLALEVGRMSFKDSKENPNLSTEELITKGNEIIERMVNLKKDVENKLAAWGREHNFRSLNISGDIDFKIKNELSDTDEEIITSFKTKPGGLLLGYDSITLRRNKYISMFSLSYGPKRRNFLKCSHVQTGDIKSFNGIPVYCVRANSFVDGYMVDWVIKHLIEQYGFKFIEFKDYGKTIQQIDLKLLHLLLPYAYQNHADIRVVINTNTDYYRLLKVHNSFAHAHRKNNHEIEFTHFIDPTKRACNWSLAECNS